MVHTTTINWSALQREPVVNFPKPFQCYKPQSHKVYGCVCMSPANRVLLVKGRRSGKWSFPKGHKNGSETYLACALRETVEETGLDLSRMKPMACHKLSAGEYYFFELDSEIEPTVKDTGEVEAAEWFTLEEMAELPSNVDVSCFLSRMNRGYRRKRSVAQPTEEEPGEVAP